MKIQDLKKLVSQVGSVVLMDDSGVSLVVLSYEQYQSLLGIELPNAEIEPAFGSQGQVPRGTSDGFKDNDNVGTGIEGAGNKVINHNADIALPSLRTKEGVSPEDWDKLNAQVSRPGNVGTGAPDTAEREEVERLNREIGLLKEEIKQRELQELIEETVVDEH